MKKLYIIVAALLACSIFTGCGDNDLATYSGPEYVQFAQSSGEFAVKEQGDQVYGFTVGTTRPAAADLALTIGVDADKSTAVEGRDFRLLTPVVTIPAGEMTGTVKIEGIYDNLSPEGVRLVLKIEGADERINPNFGNTYTLALSRKYELTMEKLVGTYLQKGYDPDGKTYENDLTIRKISDTEIEMVHFAGLHTVKASVDFDNATFSISGNQVLLPDYTDGTGKKYGDLCMVKVVLNGWELLDVSENAPIVGKCLYTGNMELESWALVNWENQALFGLYEKTMLIKK